MPKRGSDNTRMLRHNIILNLLNKRSPYGGMTITELAARCGVSERQVYRDLDHIENELRVGLVRPENNTSGKEGSYRLDAGYLPSISPEKAAIIFLSLLQQKGSALTGSINEVKDALMSTLFKYKYSPQSLRLDSLQERIHIVEEELADPRSVGEHFARLVEAIEDSFRVKLWYFVSHKLEETQRVVEPYGLICKRQNWYLLGRCLQKNDIRVFRVDQIRNVFPYTNERFTYPKDFSLQEHMAESWGVINDGDVKRVRVKFSKSVAHRVRSIIYHPSQQVEELPDGSAILSFEICGLTEFKTWVIQWGDTAEVLEPESLREDIKNMALAVAGVYGK